MPNTPEVIMYARERYCPDTTRARTRLSYHGIPWTEYDIEADAERKAEIMAKTGKPNVPQIIIGDRILIEPSFREIDEALMAAGFDIDEDA